MPGQGISFTGSTGPGGSEGGSQPDPANWLGRQRASQLIHDQQSTITATQSADRRNELIDSARIGDGDDAHELKWLAVLTGPAAMAAARIMSFDSATGSFKLDREIGPGLATSGDFYRLYLPGNVFANVTSEQASQGTTEYRSITLENNHGATLTAVKIYFVPLGSFDAAGVDRMHQASSGFYIERSDGVTDILNSLGARVVGGGSDGFLGGTGGWRHPFGYATADTLVANLINNQHIGIWLRRVIPPGSLRRRSVAVQIIAESTVAGSDPDPLRATGILCWNIDRDDPEGELSADRFVHVGGGARLQADVTVDCVPANVRAVRFAVRAGDPGLIFSDDDPLPGFDVTDAQGRAFATFDAPDSPLFAGVTSHPQLIIGAGTEVGDPQPRVTFSAIITAGFEVNAAIETATETMRTYLDDPFTERLYTI